jgi:hypothetical protein
MTDIMLLEVLENTGKTPTTSFHPAMYKKANPPLPFTAVL